MNLSTKPISQVLADNLRHYMAASHIETHLEMATRSGVARRSVGNYLRPVIRQATVTGKEPSANLSELSKLAKALQIEVWQLLRDSSPEEMRFQSAIEAAYRAIPKS